MDESSEREKALRLFSYLTRLAEMRSKAVYDVKDFETCLWFDDIPKEVETFAVRSTTLEGKISSWIKVKKIAPPPPPLPPADCRGWYEPKLLNDHTKEPTLSSSRFLLEEVETSDGVFLSPSIQSLANYHVASYYWESYLQEWRQWTIEAKRVSAINHRYAQLYRMHEHAEREREQFEVVLAVGLLKWNTGKTSIRRHILTIPAVIELVPQSSEIRVRPDGYFSFEEDMLDASQAPDRRLLTDIKDKLQELGNDAFSSFTVDESTKFGADTIAEALTLWSNNTHPDSVVSMDFNTSEFSKTPPFHPLVTLMPALILRRRTQRSLVKMYETIKDALEVTPDSEMPENILDLLSARGDTSLPSQKAERAQRSLSGFEEEEVFFPLPSNSDQQSIVHALDSNRGVVVQGPPGTGKSHTIANLMAHLLAQGQRILVTSQTDQALQVLRAKLPAGLAELCVGVVGAGKEGAADLEKSLNALDRELNKTNWDAQRLDAIASLETKIEEVKSQRTKLLAKARLARETELESCGFGKYNASPSVTITRLQLDETKHSWLKDDITDDALNSKFLLNLRESLLALDSNRRVKATEVIPVKAPSPSDFSKWCEDIKAFRSGKPVSATFTPLASYSSEQRVHIQGLVQTLETCLLRIESAPFSWVQELSNQVLKGSLSEVNALKEITYRTLDTLRDADRIESYNVSYSDQSDLSLYYSQALRLENQLAAGAKLKKLGRATSVAKDAEYLISGVTLAGRAIMSAEDCQQVIQTVALDKVIKDCKEEWGGRIALRAASTSKLHQLEEALTFLDLLTSLSTIAFEVNDLVKSAIGSFTPNWGDKDERTEFIGVLERLQLSSEISLIESQVKETRVFWKDAAEAPNASEVSVEGLRAIERLDTLGYAKAHQKLQEILKEREHMSKESVMIDSLKEMAPRLKEELLQSAEDPAWVPRFEAFSEAKDWSKSMHAFKKIMEGNASDRVSIELKNLEVRLLNLVGELGEQKAWLKALERLSPKDLEHLRAYQLAVRRIGKGTGKGAIKERQNAQKHMDAARDAVPAWIMPIYRVVESLKADRESFDVVIIDEASQAGVDALFLLWMGKKIVVVGDDKQISPSAVGIEQEAVVEYQRQYLHDFDSADVFDPRNSFFDQAAVRYQGRIMLTEHFRCMPEIIGFSNALMYDGKLQALKQFGQDRLPPLQSVYVPGAETKKSRGSVINQEEAKAIVEKVKECVNNPRYAGLSIGVVSLLGVSQADYIFGLLAETLTSEQMSDHDIRCSDAPGFQGDERDIIFLSMVVAPNENGNSIPALGRFEYYQRFNVAASRAETQMWLFHSVKTQELNPTCPRHKLLSYVSSPPVAGVKELKGEVTRDQIREPFDSLFEQRVYLDIVERGYEVVPQWQALGRFIDLVVVGDSSRLAVECDGDYWHGADKYQEDMARERDLQRVGWEFFRVRGSAYYHDKEKALEGLWLQLEAKGIKPKSIALEEEPALALTQEVLVLEKDHAAVSSALEIPVGGETIKEVSLEDALGQQMEPPTLFDPPGEEPQTKEAEEDTSLVPVAGAVESPVAPSPQEVEPAVEKEALKVEEGLEENASVFSAPLNNYLERLVDPARKEYAEQYALFLAGVTPEPARPNQLWANKVKSKVERFF